MRVEGYFSHAELEPADVQGKVVIVVDVLRATSTMAEALANGARAIYPTSGAEDAIKLATSLGREDLLLAGERKGLPIEGYDLGNSPLEFTRERIEGKRLIMNTTNGTPAFMAVLGAERVVAASFLNLTAVADAVADAERLVVVCAGRAGRFSLDDAVCAGMILGRLEERADAPLAMDDAAAASRTLARGVSVDASFLGGTDAGRALVDVGLEADLEHCARLDHHRVVPEMHDRMVRLSR